jgi:hypothetical protein
MTSKKDSPKAEAQTKSYQKKATVDSSNWVVDPRLKAANDKMVKALVDNLNRNTSGQNEESDQQ